MLSNPSPAAPRRTTRATTRRKKEDEDFRHQETVRAERAKALMCTPLLQALPAVLSSGYLYQFECMTAASTCQDWYYVWKDVEKEFPEESKVRITIEHIAKNWLYPTFIDQNGLLETIHTPTFVRQIYDKVNDLKMAAKKGKAAQAKFQAALPVWGVGVKKVTVHYWGRTPRNNGGICITYYKSDKLYSRSVLMVRLHPDLRLWTGIRSWQYYDGTPLWP